MVKKTTKNLKFFPHIFRKISATIFLSLKIVLLIIGLCFLFLNLHSLFFPEEENYQKLKLAVLKEPFNPQVHQQLFSYYLNKGQVEKAEKELDLIAALTSSSSPILSSATSQLEELKNKPEKIKAEIDFWEKIVAEKKDYRDVYLKLAIIYYQLNQKGAAKENLEKALELDPNFEPAKTLEKML